MWNRYGVSGVGGKQTGVGNEELCVTTLARGNTIRFFFPLLYLCAKKLQPSMSSALRGEIK